MKKIITFFLIGILTISGLASAALIVNVEDNYNEIIAKFNFFKPEIKKVIDNFIDLELRDNETYSIISGKPILPKETKVFEIPFGSNVVNVDILKGVISDYKIQSQVRPGPYYKPLNNLLSNKDYAIKDESIYSSDELYPDNWYSYKVRCGLNSINELVTFVAVNIYPIRYQPISNKLYYLDEAKIIIKYNEFKYEKSFESDSYDLIIISPPEFLNDLQRLVIHKNEYISTFLKSTDDIYAEYSGRDRPEQIKYFIKDAIENWDTKYVLLVGGLKSMFFGSSRDDRNQGSKDWYIPVRYTNLYAGQGDDPGYISDLYYADIYKEGGLFDDWDSNGNDIFAEWDGLKIDTLDLIPDVYVGRLACRNKNEVNIMIDKIIKYEENPADSSWFNKIIVIAGDAFQDQQDLDIIWDTNSLPDGDYTIYAQSNNNEGLFGPIDSININIDKSIESNITFTEDDHLKTDVYPYLPIAEITSPSDGDVLGNSNVNFVPPEAYDGYYWARVEYSNGIMHIRGKSYDPQPYGVFTDMKVWINNNADETIFVQWRNNTEIYYEDEWTTGEQKLDNRGGTLYYMPDNYESKILWTSNGIWTGQSDVIDALSEGSGFVHFFGHASPRTWGDQYPGIPGGRREASVTGLICFDPFTFPPIFPMNKISNNNKLPIV
jgi:hypothetical protein